MRRTALVSILLLGGAGCTTKAAAPPVPPASSSGPSAEAPAPAARPRWIALGDSYTKGEAASADEAWPAVAAARLEASGRPVELVANLGRTGWTTRDVLAKQVPRLDRDHADLVTVQVGINDLVQGVSEDRFRSDLKELLAALVARTGSPGRVVAVTIPDFSVAAAAPSFGDPETLHSDIQKRNAIIIEEAQRAGVRTADIFGRSREALRDGTLLAKDGIHPSAKGYAAWVPDILPSLEAALGKP